MTAQTLAGAATISQPELSVVAPTVLTGQDLTGTATLSQPELSVVAPTTLSAQTLAGAATISQPELTTAIVPPTVLTGQDLTGTATISQPELVVTEPGAVNAQLQDLTAAATISRPELTTVVPDATTLTGNRLAGAATLTRPLLSAIFPPAVPGQVSGLVAGERSYTTIIVSWDIPDSPGGTITSYQVRVGSGMWTDTGSTATEYQIAGLEPGTSYSITVRAVNATGEGTTSAALTVETSPRPDPVSHVAYPHIRYPTQPSNSNGPHR